MGTDGSKFICKNGSEPGLIQYPRFPLPETQIRVIAFDVAEGLRQVMRQQRVSIVFPDETVLLEG
jgi:hypothetical protein